MPNRLRIAPGPCALALALALTPALVHAQANPRITNQIAANHFQLGSQYFQIAHYADAAHEFQQAYDLTHQPELLFNIGRALEADGNINAALDAYQRFLDAGSPGFDRETLRLRMETLRQRAAASAASNTNTPQGGTATGTEPATGTGATTATPQTPPPEPHPPSPPPPVMVRERTTLATVGPIAVAGVGLVCAGLAVWQGISASGHISTLNQANAGTSPWSAEADNAYRSAPGEVTAAYALGIAGGVLVAVGAAWFALGVPSEEHPAPTSASARRRVIRPFIAPAGSGAMVGIGGVL